ncbi:hypothetical protein LSH36_303g03102 [Paralvinella palmiformis]|uniref:Glutathione synthetase n=1 Tax=Paralvinella palmiformis TaxID=53620 RepID=A0AAD9JIE2_9ANNE|nr:hypothetical protein LSH36_303g03102 [Paralvinella palmiformis]
MDDCIKLPLDEEQLEDLVLQAKDYLLSHGLVLRTVEKPDSNSVVTHAPVTLLPSPVPKALYEYAQGIQNNVNLLMHRIAVNHDFLWKCLEKVIQVDDFTRHLWEIYDTVTKEGVAQPYSLGLNRADYMLDCGIPVSQLAQSKVTVDSRSMKLRMVEVNLMSASFGGLSQRLKYFHKFILERLHMNDKVGQIPTEAGAADVLAKGILTAWEYYGKSGSVVLFLILDQERNIYDQRHLEYSLYQLNPKVKVICKTLKDVTERGRLTDDARLVIDGDEVAIVYQRCLYAPTHYSSEEDWQTRLLLERSKAIKCPSAGYHLAGTKKVQQVLAKPGVLEQFLTDPEAIQSIRNTFAGQYSLDLGKEGDEAVTMALNNPQTYVLKPQREGGGNNIYGDDIRVKLSEMEKSLERTAYILMDRIHPYLVQNYLIFSGKPVELYNCVSELGIYGAFVGTPDDVILNFSGGCCLRTKAAGTNEGGVATGYSCLDSPFLI